MKNKILYIILFLSFFSIDKVYSLNDDLFITLSEVMYSSPLDNQNGSFIEVYNAGADYEQIMGWSIWINGVKVFVFDDEREIDPYSAMVVVFKKEGTRFDFKQWYSNVPSKDPIFYQSTALLNPSGGYVQLKDSQGNLRDDVYYGGNWDSARNTNGTLGWNCLSIQRTEVRFSDNCACIPDQSKWITDYVTPLRKNGSFDKAVLPEKSGQNFDINDYTSSNENYVRTSTKMNKEGTQSSDVIQYFDGYGRLVQTSQVGSSPSKKDVIERVTYSRSFFDKIDKTYLPFSAETNGNFVYDPSFFTSDFNNDSRAYSETIYENSPLARVAEQYGPGEEWYNAKKSSKIRYLTNSSHVNEKVLHCTKYYIDSNGKLSQSGNYKSSGELFVTEFSDEEGNKSYEFKNKLGQVVLTRQANTANNRTEYLDTYFVYDDFSNLRYVLPPMAVDKLTDLSDDNEVMKQYVFVYKYDKRKRCIKKRLPGCEWIYMVYDKADQLILSQDGEQRKENKWAFNAYDKFGRPVFSGIHKDHYGPSAGRTHEYLMNQFKDLMIQETSGWFYGYSTLLYEALGGSAPFYYRRCNGIFSEVKLINYYDRYDTLYRGYFSDGIADFETKEGFKGKKHQSAKGLLTAVMEFYDEHNGNTDPCESDYKYTATAFFYDEQGNMIQKKTKNHMGGLDKEYIDYNFTNQPTKRLHEHTAMIYQEKINPPGTIILPPASTTPEYEFVEKKTTELYTYDYDHAGRLVKTTHQLNDQSPVILAENTYDELGRLKTTTPNQNQQLKTEYSYNVRSWTSNIRNAEFTQQLDYTFNGNVKSTVWTQADMAHRYNFRYDGISRLLEGMYSAESANALGSYNTWYSYDKNGNPLQIQREAFNAPDNSNEYVDYMSLIYNGNQVKTVRDGGYEFLGSNGYDFKDYSGGADVQYAFDANGSMTHDPYKGTTISYGHLNLPKSIRVDNPISKGTIDYVYSFTGQKLKVTYQEDLKISVNPITGGIVGGGLIPPVTQSNDKRLDYAGNKIYTTGVNRLLKIQPTYLDQILTENGYIKGGIYYFYVRDHLGNNRIVADQSGTVVQRNDYYPFGAPFAESSNPNTQRFKFGGKELDMMHGLNLFDFHARQLDSPRLQFTTVDPHAENYYNISLYAYCYNNPMRIIDPTGMDTLNMYLPEVTVSSKMPKNGFILAADSYYPQLKTIEAEPEMQVTYQTVSHLPMPGTGGWKSLWQGIKSLPKLIQGGSKLLGRAIGTNSKNIKWILSKHGVDQASKYANKSKFYNVATETDVKRLVDASTHMSVTVQSNGNHLRVVYADRIIGFDANTQRVTNVYSVITNPKTGELITMFPGLP